MNLSISDQSFSNFLWDVFVSSSSFKEMFFQNENLLSENEKSSLLKAHFDNLQIWVKLYKERISFLKKNVSLQRSNKKIVTQDVYYHPRFGWVVSNANDKAFLGKIDILEDVKLDIGCRTYFSGHGTLRGNSTVNIGSFTAIAEGVSINSSFDAHPIDYPSLFGFKTERRLKEDNMDLQLKYKKLYQKLSLKQSGITIGNDVWLCRNVRILNGVTIGDGCVIAENAFVNKDCEPYGVYAGIPAKLVKYRFSPEIIEQLREMKWWDWDYDKISRNTQFFDTYLHDYNGALNTLITL